MKKNLILIVVSVFFIMTITACSNRESRKQIEEKIANNNEVNTDIEAGDDVEADEDVEASEDIEASEETKDTEDIVVSDNNDINDGRDSSNINEVNSGEVNTPTSYEMTDEGIITSKYAKETIEKIAEQLIDVISKKHAVTIAEYVHPEKGVRFTPYTHVSVEDDIVFQQEEIKNFFDDRNIYQWGFYDGTGDEISLTPKQYFDEFIYTADFISAPMIGYNEVLRNGNMEENQFEVYKNAIVVEYYFSGFDSTYGGADWQSLRLVFEPFANDWKLVGVIHNQMTL